MRSWERNEAWTEVLPRAALPISQSPPRLIWRFYLTNPLPEHVGLNFLNYIYSHQDHSHRSVNGDPALETYSTMPVTITLQKTGLGVGISLDGGRYSIYGDRPIVVKKIFDGQFIPIQSI